MNDRLGHEANRVIERRTAPRIDAFGQLHGYIVGRRQRAVVLDISTGGLGIATREPLEVGSVHEVRLTTRDGYEAQVEVRVVNRREASTPADTVYYVIGAKLTHETESLNEIIDHLVSALSFDIDVA